MTTPFYNLSYGAGFEGILNYTNEITNGWFGNLFIAFIFIATLVTLSKSDYKIPGVLSFCFVLTLITSMIFSLFMEIEPYIIFISIIGLGISVAWGIITKNRT